VQCVDILIYNFVFVESYVHFATTSALGLGTTETPVARVPRPSPRVKRQGREASHFPQFPAEVNNVWSITSSSAKHIHGVFRHRDVTLIGEGTKSTDEARIHKRRSVVSIYRLSFHYLVLLFAVVWENCGLTSWVQLK